LSIDRGQPANVCVTGAAGFIGSNLVHWILEHWPESIVTSLDALTYAGNLANLEAAERNPRHRFIHGNICDNALMTSLIDDGITTIINAAAHTHVDRSLLGADEFVTTNVGGVQNILECMRDRSGIRLVQVSTDEVYGSQPPGVTADENAMLTPRNPYSAAKAGGDLIALAYHHSFGHDVVITRCCNNYGPYQYPEKVIPLFISNLFEGKKVPLYGDGLNQREWIHVDDHSAAIAAVCNRGKTGHVYNISSGKGMSNLDLTHTLIELCGADESAIEYVADRPGHDRRYALNDAKIRTELGWSPKLDFKTGLEQTVQWYRNNEAWWQNIKSGEYRKYYEQQYARRTAR
jgi:dTDP-glucose 4,6-dehydratase